MNTFVNTEKTGRNPESFFTLNPRRRRRLLQPSLQLRFPVFAILLTILFLVSVVSVLYVAFGNLFLEMLEDSPWSDYRSNAIQSQASAAISVVLICTLAYAILVVIFSIVFTHQMVGPTVAFERQIKAFKQGSFSTRVTLRKNDGFHNIARELNELGEILEKNSR